jgi:hypothetical protein
MMLTGITTTRQAVIRLKIKFSYMRSDRFLDLRRSLHALKLDFGRSFHFRLFSCFASDCGHHTYLAAIRHRSMILAAVQ